MMTKDEALQLASIIGDDARGELMRIAEEATSKYGVDSIMFQPRDARIMARVLTEVQDQSFMLGVTKTVECIISIMQGQPVGTHE